MSNPIRSIRLLLPEARSARTLFLFLAVLLLGTLVSACATSGTAQSDYYDDWWICVDDCGEDAADCVDACTDDFNASHDSPGKDTPPFRLQRRSGGDGPPGIPPIIVNRCPPGTVLTPFPMPIYDDDGLFVIGHETVWYCLPEDLEPAG